MTPTTYQPPKPREMTASHITQVALSLLKLMRYVAWRQANIAPMHRKGIVKAGVADILGYHRENGRMLAVETKTLNDYLSPEQIEFLAGVAKSGGAAYIACQVGSEVRLVLFDEYVKK